MNQTAVMHATAAVLAGAGVLVSEQLVRFGLFGVAVVLFAGGIVVARRDDDPDPAEDA
jgi:hypothetical protein